MTEVMKQYMAVKERYPDAIVFFRMGDFYEMFYDDAVTAARELEIALTSRNKKDKDSAPMCGVPYHSVDGYIAKMIAKGYKIAICEQLEDPKTVKGLVKRDVVRLITPGTVTDTQTLNEKENNFLVSIVFEDGNYGISICDITTGELLVTEIPGSDTQGLINELARYKPSEVILTDAVFNNKALVGEIEYRFSSMINRAKEEPVWANSKGLILSRLGEKSLSLLGVSEDAHVVNALGVMFTYLDLTQKMVLPHIREINYYCVKEYLEMDVFTRKNLELTETLRHSNRRGSLLWVLDKTKTSMGGRMLRSFIEKPLVNCSSILKRLYAVDELIKNSSLREEIAEKLKEINDMERLLAKVTCKTVNCRELLALLSSFDPLPELELMLSKLKSPLFEDLNAEFDTLGDIYELLSNSLTDSEDVPTTIKDGEIIKDGYDAEIDELRKLKKDSGAILDEIELREKELTGIKNLRIAYNRVFGYFIEVSNSNKDMVPAHYIRKQTLTTGERFITEELKVLEDKILGASEKLKAREYELFCNIREQVAGEVARIQKTAAIIALTDVLCSFAEVSEKNNYTMPYVDMSDKIDIKDGRHPVVEKVLKDELFVPNDTLLNSESDRFLIITGPNMAGKSTYMRQVAVITLMAQIGCFVPASSCHIGIVDKIFTRVGASDDLSSGQSTFMVEMTEVSNILKNATSKSLLVLDEIGRGTSTYDGLAIAWSVCEYIADKKKIGARTLFATHYHELTELEEKLEGIKNYCIACKKRGDSITFLRRIIKGGADESYGIEVAALAGIPKKVVTRAKEILAGLTDDDFKSESKPKFTEEDSMQISLTDSVGEEIANILRDLDITTLTPIEALNKLYELQKMAK